MPTILSSKSANRSATALERTPGGGAQEWWNRTGDTATLSDIATATVESRATVKLTELPIGEPARTTTVLVVDDEPLMREFIAELLRDSGYQVLEASGAMEAQQLARNNNIDLLLTDFSMPGTNGLELARWFQSKYPQMKILIATGALWDLVNQVGEHERLAVLPKPFDVVQLSRMVKLVLG